MCWGGKKGNNVKVNCKGFNIWYAEMQPSADRLRGGCCRHFGPGLVLQCASVDKSSQVSAAFSVSPRLPPPLSLEFRRQASSLLGFSWKCQSSRTGGCADSGQLVLTTCELQLPGDFNRVGEDTLILKGHAASAASDIRWTFCSKGSTANGLVF